MYNICVKQTPESVYEVKELFTCVLALRVWALDTYTNQA